MMEDEIKSTAAGEENQAGAHAPSTPSEAVAAPAPTPAADVNASVSAPAAANPAAAQQGAPASFCRNCGQALAVGDAFCPKCGTPRGIAGATSQPAAAPVNAAAAQPVKIRYSLPFPGCEKWEAFCVRRAMKPQTNSTFSPSSSSTGNAGSSAVYHETRPLVGRIAGTIFTGKGQLIASDSRRTSIASWPLIKN